MGREGGLVTALDLAAALLVWPWVLAAYGIVRLFDYIHGRLSDGR